MTTPSNPNQQPNHSSGTAEQARALIETAAARLAEGDANQALTLYRRALPLFESLTDRPGQAHTLFAVANLEALDGNLETGLTLYEQALAVYRDLDDERGQAAVLCEIASLRSALGDPDSALPLYRESLALYERLNEPADRATTLYELASAHLLAEDREQGAAAYRRALDLYRQVNDQAGIAFTLVRLGQLAEGEDDLPAAIAHYREALTLFDRLDMPQAEELQHHLAALAEMDDGPMSPYEAVQAVTRAATDVAREQQSPAAVREAIDEVLSQSGLGANVRAYLKGLRRLVKRANPKTLQTLFRHGQAMLARLPDAAPGVGLAMDLARLFEVHAQLGPAVDFQHEAITRLRKQGEGDEVLRTLAVLLYNHAALLAQLDRFPEAVETMSEVVRLDRRLNLPELAEDEQTLEQLRQRRDAAAPPPTDLSPEGMAALEARLADLPPDERTRIQQWVGQFLALSPHQQEAIVAAEAERRAAAQADQLLDLALDAWETDRLPEILLLFDQSVKELVTDRDRHAAPARLGRFVWAMAALLRGKPAPPVDPAYRERLERLQRRIQGAKGSNHSPG